jgi:hypothetical protein
MKELSTKLLNLKYVIKFAEVAEKNQSASNFIQEAIIEQ